MPQRIPKYRRSRRKNESDLALVEINGKRIYLGVYGSEESREAYQRIIAGLIASAPASVDDPISVKELLAAFWLHAEKHYRKPDGRQTSELGLFTIALRPLRARYGETPAIAFGPSALRSIREEFIESGFVRRSINQHVRRIREVFRWGAEHELVPVSVLEALRAVRGLQRGRCDAPDNAPVRPVLDAHVDAVRSRVSRQVAALIDLQLLTAARPGELVVLRPCDIDRAPEIWEARPESHKTLHHGHDRVVYLGPQAQAVVAPFLAGRAPAVALFSPREAEEERRVKLEAERTTPRSCGNRRGTNRRGNPRWQPGDTYSVDSYRRAIRRACELAKIPVWTPHRLRHNAATEIRRQFGLEAAAVILGHSSPVVTEVYADRDRGVARRVAARLG